MGKDTRIGELESEIDTLKEQISQAKSKNEELRERNWKAMDAIANAESISKQKATALGEAEKKITELETTSETADDELNSTRAENVKFKGILAETETMLNTLQSEVDAEHNGLHERIRELEARLASKELEQKQSEQEKSDMIKRLESVAAKQQKMLNKSDRKIEKLESKLKNAEGSSV